MYYVTWVRCNSKSILCGLLMLFCQCCITCAVLLCHMGSHKMKGPTCCSSTAGRYITYHPPGHPWNVLQIDSGIDPWNIRIYNPEIVLRSITRKTNTTTVFFAFGVSYLGGSRWLVTVLSPVAIEVFHLIPSYVTKLVVSISQTLLCVN